MKVRSIVLRNLYRGLISAWAGMAGLICLLNTSVSAGTPAPDDQSAPAIASNGEVTLLVWQDRRSGKDYDVYGAWINSSGAVLNKLRLGGGPGDQVQPAVAANGTDFLVVWVDHRQGGTADIYGTRVTTAGEVLNPLGWAICTAPLNQGHPAVASNGDGFLVVWQDFRSGVNADIFGVRVSASGLVLDPSGLVISQGPNNQLNPVVAGNGAGYMVVWQDNRQINSYDIYGTQVTAAGLVVQSSGLPVSTASGDQINPTVTSNGSDFLVGWQDFRSENNFDIYGSVVTGNGVVNQATGVALCQGVRDQFNPRLASQGGDFMAVWTDYRDGANGVIHGTKISAAGLTTASPEFVLSPAQGEHYHPVVASSPVGYWVCWQGYRDGGPADIYGSRISDAGVVLDIGGLLLSGEAGNLPPQTPVITWVQPADITYGTALGSGQLNATASVAGSFSYQPPSGTVLGAGRSQILSVAFTPADSQAYTSASAMVAINVNPAPLTIRADDKTKLAGQPNPPLTATYSGFVNHDTLASLNTPVSLSTTATTTSPAGVYPIIAADATAANYLITLVNGALTVTALAPVSLAVQPASATISVGQTQAFTATATYSDGSQAVVTSAASWQSANPSVAQVDSSGVATGVAAGQTAITAALGNLTASGMLAVTVTTPPTTLSFANTTAIQIPEVGRGYPYPSRITVTGMSGVISKVTVRLVSLKHGNPDDLDVLLVSPTGQKVLLMSDAGGAEDVEHLTLTFDDSATVVIPDKNRLRSGTYRPANYSGFETFASPAPSGPYAATLSAFNLSNPNGIWSLYLIDDARGGSKGTLAGGWSLTIGTVAPTDSNTGINSHGWDVSERRDNSDDWDEQE